VRFHALSPLVSGGDAHDRHATFGPVARASPILIGLVDHCTAATDAHGPHEAVRQAHDQAAAITAAITAHVENNAVDDRDQR
jgi:hypothetical protein